MISDLLRSEIFSLDKLCVLLNVQDCISVILVCNVTVLVVGVLLSNHNYGFEVFA